MRPVRVIALLIIACQLLIRSLAAPHVHSADHAHDVSPSALRRSHLHLSAFCHQDSHHHHDHRRHDHDAVKSASHGHSHSDEADVALNFDECQSDSEQHHRTLMVDEESLALTTTNSQPMHPWATESILGSFASIDDWNSTLHRGLCTPASCQHLSTVLRPDLPLMLRI